jgi:hypothetical protein
LLLWLVVQFAALALAAARVPLFAQYPQPGEFHAITILSCVQWPATVLLFPVLWKTWRGALWVAGSGVVMLLFAAALAGKPAASVLPSAGCFTLFVFALLAWGTIARTTRSKMHSSAIFAALTVGGPLLAYLREDLGAAGPGGGAKWKWGPFWLLLQNPENPAKECWISLIFVLALGCLIRLLQSRRQIRAAKAI